jgi:hypothetical protein
VARYQNRPRRRNRETNYGRASDSGRTSHRAREPCVTTHLSTMYHKTGTENQVQLLRWAFREAQAIDRRFQA